jgi:DNA polymerase
VIISGDFETYWSKDYSLTKLSEVEYVLDPRFQVIMLALKLGDQPSKVYVGYDAIARRLQSIDWGRAAWLSHNTRFDGSILSWHFGYVPKLYLDTLSMARATTHWVTGRSSLAKISEYLKLPPKGDEVVRAMDKRLEDFTYEELENYKTYCMRDNDNCYEIFKKLRPIFSASELQIIDLILRMFIQPQVVLDTSVLSRYLQNVQAEKAEILDRVLGGIDKGVFSSNQKFARLLEDYGVDVPMKLSPTTGKLIPATARNDRAFKLLCADEEQPPEVQALLHARVSVKSTIEETRTANLLRLSCCNWPDKTKGWGPVPLKYSGARTHRLSGDGGTNWQNFKRGSPIREAIMAPPGYRVVHRDASQIEARMVAWLAQCHSLTSAFAMGRDVYSEFATAIYGRGITKANTLERFVGKTAILGLGYGCGVEKFQHMLFIGNGGLSLNVTPEFAKSTVYQYRNTYYEIPALWAHVEHLLADLVQLARRPRQFSFFESLHTAMPSLSLPVVTGFDALWLPNGLCINYPNIRWYRDDQTGKWELCYDDPQGVRKIYGAKGVENISQALARIVVTDAMVRTYQATGYRPFLSTHDSLDYCVPEDKAEEIDAMLSSQFGITPDWAEGLPLASEGGWGRTLLEAERGVNA